MRINVHRVFGIYVKSVVWYLTHKKCLIYFIVTDEEIKAERGKKSYSELIAVR